MKINKFLNVNEQEVDFSSNINVILGKNGSGKTNLLRSLVKDLTINHLSTKKKEPIFIYIPISRALWDNKFEYRQNLTFGQILKFYSYDNISEIEKKYEVMFSKIKKYAEDNGLNEEISKIMEKLFGNIVESNKYDYEDQSDGVKSIYVILASIITIGQICLEVKKSNEIRGTIIIDEIDAYIHQSIQNKIIETLEQEFPKVTFILTTHSPFIVRTVSSKNKVFKMDEGFLYKQSTKQYSSLNVIMEDIFETKLFPEDFQEILTFVGKYNDPDFRKNNQEKYENIKNKIMHYKKTFPDLYEEEVFAFDYFLKRGEKW